MKKVLLSIFMISIALCVYAATDGKIISTIVHAEMELACEDCHNTKEPVKRAPVSTCKGCHGNLDGTYKGMLSDDGKLSEKVYPEGNSTKTVNFHNSHQGDLRCTLCHTAHKQPVLYCNECHDFKVLVK